ncbi:winged helix-turn-helix domain-containing protein [Gaopeijia maritima]|uniref:winged helix-turn-helix domain-containing protein n=1 Tax=Gaopeijia maritima TaxID=3119007 RepID=UPI0032438FBE
MNRANPEGSAQLGEVRFDAESGDMRGPDGRSGRLAPQPARLLALLVAHRGSVVSRAEIADHLWPAGAGDADAGIAFAIREIRKGLEAAGADADLVETIPRRGYRLRARPRVDQGAARAPTGARVAMLATVALVAWAVVTLAPRGTPGVAVFPWADANDPSIDTAPPVDLGARVTTRLTRAFADRLGVIGPNGVADLEGPTDTDGAAALGACLVISGSVREAGDTGLVVFSQIVRSLDRVHVWARWDTIPPTGSLDPLLEAVEAGVGAASREC